MADDDLIKNKREVDLGKFWKTGMDIMHQKFIKNLMKDSEKSGKQKIGKSVESELIKAQTKLGMTRKIHKQ